MVTFQFLFSQRRAFENVMKKAKVKFVDRRGLNAQPFALKTLHSPLAHQRTHTSKNALRIKIIFVFAVNSELRLRLHTESQTEEAPERAKRLSTIPISRLCLMLHTEFCAWHSVKV